MAGNDVRTPGRLVRAMAGAWHVPAGFLFLLRRPALWPLAAVPALLAALFVTAGIGAGLYAVPAVEETVVRGRKGFLGGLLSIAVWIGTPLGCVLLGLAAALVLGAPVLEQLGRKVETARRGRARDAQGGLVWEAVESVRGALYFLVRAPLAFVIGLVPIVGPVLGGLWAAHALAIQQTDPVLARHGLKFEERRAWHRHWRPESLGFGLAGLFVLVVPFANFLLAPALATGATLLVLDLQEEDDFNVEFPPGVEPPRRTLPPLPGG
jgi:CysZ protein